MPPDIIPRKIHYCWFGGAELPDSAKKCIKSWEKFFPGYEIIQWNETNYDVKKNTYIEQAYQARKYAFVSDFARFDILYHEGGLYFDTDVEVIQSFSHVISKGPFWGLEINNYDLYNRSLNPEKLWIYVNPGLGMGAPSGLRIYKEILEYYSKITFFDEHGRCNEFTVVEHIASVLRNKEITENNTNTLQVDGISIYPREYFNPFDSITGKVLRTKETHSIHWYSMSWLPPKTRLRAKVTRRFRRIFGKNSLLFLKKIELKLKR